MKTLQNHMVLYDAECPMCKAYTKAFTGLGLLDAGGRAAYQDMPNEVCPMVDMQRAVNEIALVDIATGQVSYGIDSLFKIFANTFPLLKPLFLFRPFAWLMGKFYAFISYNRRVIIPPTIKPTGIQPTFKLHYRLAYLLFSWLTASYLLTVYNGGLSGLISTGGNWREYLICGGQIVFQGIITAIFFRNKLIDYLGNMMTISLAGALLLVPMIVIGHFITISSLAFGIYFLMVAGLMLIEHIRRAKLLNLGWLLSLTWIVYRLIILFLIFK